MVMPTSGNNTTFAMITSLAPDRMAGKQLKGFLLNDQVYRKRKQMTNV